MSAPLYSEHLVYLIILAVLSIGPSNVKIGPFVKLGSLRHRSSSIPLNKGWVLPGAPFKICVHPRNKFVPLQTLFVSRGFFSQDKYLSVRYPYSLPRALIIWANMQGQGKRAAIFPFFPPLLGLQLIEGV
jgi:hypothetical protein